MLACRCIFVKPSIPQTRIAQGDEASNDLQIKAFCGYYTINYHKLQESVVNFMRLYNSSADDARVFVSL